MQSTMRLPVGRLRSTASYRVSTANDSAAHCVTQSELMREGLIVSLSKPEMSNVFFLDTGAVTG
jgi:hypothetical protein